MEKLKKKNKNKNVVAHPENTHALPPLTPTSPSTPPYIYLSCKSGGHGDCVYSVKYAHIMVYNILYIYSPWSRSPLPPHRTNIKPEKKGNSIWGMEKHWFLRGFPPQDAKQT